MLRKLGIGFTALALLAPGLAAALSVGDYQLHSYLNQPLQMTVDLQDTRDLSAEQLRVRIASEEDYVRAGVERHAIHAQLRFELDVREDRTGTLEITSAQSIREPYINFLVEYQWPTGRLLREYTVLLDPPTYAADRSKPAPAKPAVPAKPAEPARRVTDESGRATRRPDPARVEYQVRQSDTMWQIAMAHRPSSSVSVQQMLVAIQDMNPDAFIDGNVNLVREGAVLRIPVEEEIRRIQTRTAISEVAQQNQRWRERLEERGIEIATRRAPVDARDPSTSDVEATPTEERGRVTLVSPETAEGEGVDEDVRGVGADEDAAALRNELAIQQESLEQLRRENRELGTRLRDVEDQVTTSERLLQLRNDQIARLQEELRALQAGEDVTVDPSLLEPLPEPEVADEPQVADEAEATGESEVAATAGDESVAGTDMSAGEQSETTPAPAEVTEAESRPAPTLDPVPQPPTIMDMIMGNVMLILGGLAAVLLLVAAWIFVRRRQQDEDDEMGDEVPVDIEEGEDDFANLMGGDDLEDESDSEVSPQEPEADPMEQAEIFVAYGQYPQAINHLREQAQAFPDRADIKVRMLELLAESGNRQEFDQAAEEFAGSDSEVDARIEALRSSLTETAEVQDDGEADDDLSLDDLEMDLTSGLDSGEQSAEAPEETEEDLDFDFNLDEEDSAEPEKEESPAKAEAGEGDEALLEELGDFELDLDATENRNEPSSDATVQRDAMSEPAESESAETEEVSLDDFSLDADEEEPAAEDEAFELDMEADDDEELTLDEKPREESVTELDDVDDALSLDDLDLADSSDELASTESEDEEELDLSLDELGLDGEDETRVDAPAVSEAEQSSEDAVEEEAFSLDDFETEVGEDAGDELSLDVEETSAESEPQPESEPEPEPETETEAEAELDAEDDDFGFLGDTDENATKLDLAKAYIDMGDNEGARDILNEVVTEGNDAQQAEARELLEQVG